MFFCIWILIKKVEKKNKKMKYKNFYLSVQFTYSVNYKLFN